MVQNRNAATLIGRVGLVGRIGSDHRKRVKCSLGRSLQVGAIGVFTHHKYQTLYTLSQHLPSPQQYCSRVQRPDLHMDADAVPTFSSSNAISDSLHAVVTAARDGHDGSRAGGVVVIFTVARVGGRQQRPVMRRLCSQLTTWSTNNATCVITAAVSCQLCPTVPAAAGYICAAQGKSIRDRSAPPTLLPKFTRCRPRRPLPYTYVLIYYC